MEDKKTYSQPIYSAQEDGPQIVQGSTQKSAVECYGDAVSVYTCTDSG